MIDRVPEMLLFSDKARLREAGFSNGSHRCQPAGLIDQPRGRKRAGRSSIAYGTGFRPPCIGHFEGLQEIWRRSVQTMTLLEL